jgi:hypothetical protein
MLYEGWCSIIWITWIEHGDTSSETRLINLALKREGSLYQNLKYVIEGMLINLELKRSLSFKR